MENRRNKRKKPLLSLVCNKKHHSDNSSCKYKPNCGGNASDSNEGDEYAINVNKSDMVSVPDQEDMNLRIKQLTGGCNEESSDDSGDENQSDSGFLCKK